MGDHAERRLQILEQLYTAPCNRAVPREIFSVETLLDILIVLYDECNTNVMKRDKRVVDFLDIGELKSSFSC